MQQGKELHAQAEKDGSLLVPAQDGIQIVESRREVKIEMDIGVNGTLVGQLDNLVQFPNGMWKIIDYKSGKWYSHYKEQPLFYAVPVRMQLNLPVNEGLIIPIKWDDNYQNPVVNGKATSIMITDAMIQKMYRKIIECLEDISWRIDCGEFDDFIASVPDEPSY